MEAWVTLATNDSYSLGALVLAHSLKQASTTKKLVVLITPGVTSSMRSKLKSVFDVVQEVNILDSRDEENLRLLKRPELGVTFTKLHCWRLTQFTKCVFLDADILVLKNADELFEREELSAAPDVGWPDCFNSGVFVFKPSDDTYKKLVEFALEKGSFDGGDQGLLNMYFGDWAHKDISKHLPFIYNMCSTACYSYLPAFKQFGSEAKIIHFIGATKPWLQYFDTETRQVHPNSDMQHLKDVLQLWWHIFCSTIHPVLSSDMHISEIDKNATNIVENVTSFVIKDLAPQSDFRDVWDPWEYYREVEQHSNNEQNESHDTHVESDSCSTTEPPIFCFESHQNDNSSSECRVYHDYPNETCSNINPIPSNEQEETFVPSKLDIPSSEQEETTIPIKPEIPESIDFSENISIHPEIQEVPMEQSQSTYQNFSDEQIACNHDNTSSKADEMNVSLDPPGVAYANGNGSNEENAGLAGAFAQFTLGVKKSPTQVALEDHFRRQAWESGTMDYMGRDSFDNIWSKICETLATFPTDQTTESSEPVVATSSAEQAGEKSKAESAVVLESAADPAIKTDILPVTESTPKPLTTETKPEITAVTIDKQVITKDSIENIQPKTVEAISEVKSNVLEISKAETSDQPKIEDFKQPEQSSDGTIGSTPEVAELEKLKSTITPGAEHESDKLLESNEASVIQKETTETNIKSSEETDKDLSADKPDILKTVAVKQDNVSSTEAIESVIKSESVEQIPLTPSGIVSVAETPIDLKQAALPTSRDIVSVAETQIDLKQSAVPALVGDIKSPKSILTDTKLSGPKSEESCHLPPGEIKLSEVLGPKAEGSLESRPEIKPVDKTKDVLAEQQPVETLPTETKPVEILPDKPIEFKPAAIQAAEEKAVPNVPSQPSTIDTKVQSSDEIKVSKLQPETKCPNVKSDETKLPERELLQTKDSEIEPAVPKVTDTITIVEAKAVEDKVPKDREIITESKTCEVPALTKDIQETKREGGKPIESKTGTTESGITAVRAAEEITETKNDLNLISVEIKAENKPEQAEDAKSIELVTSDAKFPESKDEGKSLKPESKDAETKPESKEAEAKIESALIETKPEAIKSEQTADETKPDSKGETKSEIQSAAAKIETESKEAKTDELSIEEPKTAETTKVKSEKTPPPPDGIEKKTDDPKQEKKTGEGGKKKSTDASGSETGGPTPPTRKNPGGKKTKGKK